MNLNIAVMVWGDDYVANFVNWALPSLLSPLNLPELADSGLECRFNILTHAREAQQIVASDAYKRLTGVLPTAIFELPPWDYSGPACASQNFVQHKVLEEVGKSQSAVLFCSPDVIWADGSIGYVGQSLKAGHTAIFLPTYRVTDETIKYDQDLENCKRDGFSLSPLLAGQLLMRHAHPLLGAFHYNSLNCPPHIEYVTWPVGDEGVMMYHLVRGPDCYLPHLVDWTSQELISERNRPEHIDPVQDSYVALGLSLSPLTQCSNWILGGRPASTKIFGQFMARHHASLYGLLQPVRVPCVDHPDEDLWEIEERIASDFMNDVLGCRDAVFRNEIQPEPPQNVPQSYGAKLSAAECALYDDLLKWVPGDCATRRLLQRVAGDGW
jgi:hypothetical protein